MSDRAEPVVAQVKLEDPSHDASLVAMNHDAIAGRDAAAVGVSLPARKLLRAVAVGLRFRKARPLALEV